ncbi:hypothetical protein LTS18_014039, partial [Coniosporium uncinatum]
EDSEDGESPPDSGYDEEGDQGKGSPTSSELEHDNAGQEEEMTTPVHEACPRNVVLSTAGGQSTRSSRSSFNAAADQSQAMMQTHRPPMAEELDIKLSAPSIHTGRSDRGDSVGFCASTVEDNDEFLHARLTPLSPKPMEDAEVSSYM